MAMRLNEMRVDPLYIAVEEACSLKHLDVLKAVYQLAPQDYPIITITFRPTEKQMQALQQMMETHNAIQ